MDQITELLWDEHNIAHIARHGVRRAEVSEVVFSEVVIFAPVLEHRRPGRQAVFGETDNGRPLVVFLDAPTADGRSYVLTARPMTRREEHDYQSMRAKEDPND